MRIAINGFGRIGKLVLRAFLEKSLKNVKVVAINELGSLDTSMHLLKFDSVHGAIPLKITKSNKNIKIGKNTINFFSEKNPIKFPWKSLNVDIVLECSELPKEKAMEHLRRSKKLKYSTCNKC